MNPTPQAIIADLVNKYEDKIKPALEKGEFDNAILKRSIFDICASYGSYDSKFLFEKSQAHMNYVFVVRELRQLARGRIPAQHHPGFSERISKRISELDVILSGDNDYESVRQRQSSQR